MQAAERAPHLAAASGSAALLARAATRWRAYPNTHTASGAGTAGAAQRRSRHRPRITSAALYLYLHTSQVRTHGTPCPAAVPQELPLKRHALARVRPKTKHTTRPRTRPVHTARPESMAWPTTIIHSTSGQPECTHRRARYHVPVPVPGRRPTIAIKSPHLHKGAQLPQLPH